MFKRADELLLIMMHAQAYLHWDRLNRNGTPQASATNPGTCAPSCPVSGLGADIFAAEKLKPGLHEVAMPLAWLTLSSGGNEGCLPLMLPAQAEFTHHIEWNPRVAPAAATPVLLIAAMAMAPKKKARLAELKKFKVEVPFSSQAPRGNICAGTDTTKAAKGTQPRANCGTIFLEAICGGNPSVTAHMVCAQTAV